MSDVLLGIGLATGMFYHAPVGTTFPTYPAEALAAGWKHVGDVTADGITLTMDKSTENLKNWANQLKRVILSDHSETIQAPIMDTTEESLKTVLGADKVTVTPAAGGHGKLIKAAVSSSDLPDPEQFLFLMKDGDSMIAIMCKGQIQSVESVSFAPNTSINWTPTITALDNSLDIIVDEGLGASS